MENFRNDLGFARRMLGRNAGSSLVALLILALGIGATTALYSVVRAVLLDPLPWSDSERLVMIWEANPSKEINRREMAPARLKSLVEEARSFEAIGAFQPFAELNLTGAGEPEMVQAVPVTENFFTVFNVSPTIGRRFTGEDFQAEEPVAILSRALWERRFGSDPGVIGRTIRLHGEPYEVVGVMPREFHLTDLIDAGLADSRGGEIWIPAQGTIWEARGYGAYRVIARLADGVGPEEAQTEIDTFFGRFAAEYPDTDNGWSAIVVPLRQEVSGEYGFILWTLLAAVGAVLLIACSNAAGLMLAQSAARARELAVRAALGASRGRLVRQMLTESLLLATLGGLAGIVLAWKGTDLILALSPTSLPRSEGAGLNAGVLLFAVGLTVLTMLLVGLPAALRASRVDLNASLTSGASRGSSGRESRPRLWLTIGQIAAATLLLVVSSLMIRSLLRAIAIKPGFDGRNVLSFRIDMPRTAYPDGVSRTAFLREISARLGALPGVSSVGFANQIPMGGVDDRFRLWIDGRSWDRYVDIPTAGIRAIGGDYLETLRVTQIRGERFGPGSADQDRGVILVNETMARSLWPNDDPIGRRISLDGPEGPHLRIIGIVGDIRHDGPEIEPKPEMYVPYREIEWPSVGFVLRTSTDPSALIGAVRSAIRDVDSEQALYDIRTMDERLAERLSGRRFTVALLAMFGLAALALSAIGTYGVLAWSVARRTREFGIRMAVGADRFRILATVLREGLANALVGVVVGILGAAASAHLSRSLLFGVGEIDPASYLVAAVVMVAATLCASWIPAARATRVDPVVALRHE